MNRAFLLLLALGAVAALAWGISQRLAEAGPPPRDGAEVPVPVAVAPAERGPIALRRTFSGALEAAERLLVAPRIPGRVDRLLVDIGDPVERGQVVAHLDEEDLAQGVQQAEADLEVARARLGAAKSALEVVERDLERIEGLRKDGVASESRLDAARADQLAASAEVRIAEAVTLRAAAATESARIRLGHATITADWNDGDGGRVVAERRVDEGETVSANAPLLSIVELDPILAVVFAPERDYARIAVGQTAVLSTDAHPRRTFEARVARIAPVFLRSTRQARIELSVPNADELLKPGMFVRATIQLERVPDAVVVPFEAVTERGDEVGVFVLDEDGEHVRWRPVETGVRDGDRIQVFGDGVSGTVVVLGQELCDDGSRVTVPDAPPAPGAGARADDASAP